MITLCGSTVGGALNVVGARELVMIGDPGAACEPNVINGSLLLRNNTHGLEAIGNVIGGSLNAENNSGPGPYGQPSMVAGNTKR